MYANKIEYIRRHNELKSIVQKNNKLFGSFISMRVSQIPARPMLLPELAEQTNHILMLFLCPYSKYVYYTSQRNSDRLLYSVFSNQDIYE